MAAQQRTIHTQVPTQIITVDVTPDLNQCCWIRIDDSVDFAALLGWEQWDLNTDETRKLLDACNTWLAAKPGDPQNIITVANYIDFKLEASTAPDAFGCMSIRIEAEWRFRNIESLKGGLTLHLNQHQARRLKNALDEFFTNLQNGVYSD